MDTEQKGPYFIERNASTVVVRSSMPYSAACCSPLEVKKLTVRTIGKDNIVGPIALNTGEKIVLSTTGHDDVVVEPKGEE